MWGSRGQAAPKGQWLALSSCQSKCVKVAHLSRPYRWGGSLETGKLPGGRLLLPVPRPGGRSLLQPLAGLLPMSFDRTWAPPTMGISSPTLQLMWLLPVLSFVVICLCNFHQLPWTMASRETGYLLSALSPAAQKCAWAWALSTALLGGWVVPAGP